MTKRGWRQLTGAACGFACLVLIGPTAAVAASAFAAGVPENVAADGLALGGADNYASRAQAESLALDQCRARKDASDAARSRCRILAHYDDACLSAALDPGHGTPGWGWGVGATRSAAEAQALAMCRSLAGPGRATFCSVQHTGCDGAAR